MGTVTCLPRSCAPLKPQLGASRSFSASLSKRHPASDRNGLNLRVECRASPPPPRPPDLRASATHESYSART